ncbi:MAG: P-loop NTPase [Planctomycetota bacterium]|nr:P-loop NTPase [Planctomycetota bacterium]
MMPCPFVLVTGGKGGVGKSTVAANLGVELARSKHDALLVDLDLGLANLDVLLDLPKQNDVEDFLFGRKELEDCVIRGPGGVAVLPAGSGTVAMGMPDEKRSLRLLSAVARLAAGYELVIGDSAAGIGGDVLAFAARADRVIVVTTPEPAALTDAYGVIKALDSYAQGAQGRRGEVPTPEVFVNFAADLAEARRVAGRLRTTAERFLARSPRFVGWLPRSRTVLASALEQKPFVLSDPGSLAARCLRSLAQRLAGGRAGSQSLKASECHVR